MRHITFDCSPDQSIAGHHWPLTMHPCGTSHKYPALPGAFTDAATTAGKAFATLRARAAVAGFSLGTVTETDGQSFYMLSRWGMSHPLADLAAVALFLRKVGAPA